MEVGGGREVGGERTRGEESSRERCFVDDGMDGKRNNNPPFWDFFLREQNGNENENENENENKKK